MTDPCRQPHAYKARAKRAENHARQLQAQLEDARLINDGLRFRIQYLESIVKCLERSTPDKLKSTRPLWLSTWT